MERYVDLHVHTNYSDGSLSPQEVVLNAKECGLAAIGIADHDEVGAISEAIWAGHSHGVEIVPGLELTAEIAGREIHILGYLIDHNNRKLRERLKHFRYDRFKRMERMVEELKKLGVDTSIHTVRRVAGSGSLGRLHLARALFNDEFVGSVQEAFDRYIGYGKPAYVQKPRLDVREAFGLITMAGGIPALAHPKLSHVDGSIPELIRLGLQGMEVFYTKHNQRDTRKYKNMAEKYGLLVTGGSDCHGEIKDTGLLGAVKLPYHYLTTLRERAGEANQ